MMHQTYAVRPKEKKSGAPAVSRPKGPSLADLQRGAMPSREQLGTAVNLSSAIQAKMENAFGADFSGLQLHESQTVAEAGAEAVTMGNHIAFAPGKLSGPGGQELLGHELSHVVSQARGEVSGRGFLNDSALEARADREGAMAAAGESVNAGLSAPLSASSAAAAAGPMQAKKPWKKNKKEPAPTPAPAPAPEPLAQISDEERQRSKDVLSGLKDTAKEKNSTYNTVMERLGKVDSEGNAIKSFAGEAGTYRVRFLQQHLHGKSEEEQNAMVQAFESGDDAAMAPYLSAEIKNFMNVDYSDLYSRDSKKSTAALKQMAPLQQGIMSVSDIIKTKLGKGMSLEQLGMSEDELKAFKDKNYKMSTTLGVQMGLASKRASDYSAPKQKEIDEANDKLEIHRLGAQYDKGDLDENMYRMLVQPYKLKYQQLEDKDRSFMFR